MLTHTGIQQLDKWIVIPLCAIHTYVDVLHVHDTVFMTTVRFNTGSLHLGSNGTSVQREVCWKLCKTSELMYSR